MVRNFPVCFFGTKPIGETWKFVKGGVAKGPAVRPIETSLARFSSTISGLALAEGRLCENLGVRGPSYPMCAPSCSSEQRVSTKDRSGWFANACFSLSTSIGVTTCELELGLKFR